MSEKIISGSCLCCTVKYEVKEPYLRFAHCYCSRCRKATGSSHATNLYVEPGSFKWIEGESSIKRFDLLTAESFATTFCVECGGPLPHHTRSGREIVIPAGSLDEDPAIDPQSHIFWDSRATWSCGGEKLSKFTEYTDNWR